MAKCAVKRIFNLRPWLGEDFSNYEAQEELEYSGDPKVAYSYINYLLEEQFYHYLLMSNELRLDLIDTVVERYKNRTKKRKIIQNKLLGEKQNECLE
jgi:hypothetical protein